MDSKEIIRRQFDAQARSFSSWSVTRNEEYMKAYFEFLGLNKRDELLDVACGTGEFAVFCAERIGSVHGVDISEGMIDIARKQASDRGLNNIDFQCHDVESIPCADGSFSVVQCRSAFHHMENYPKVFEEMLRCCRPDGRLAVQDIMAYEDPKVNSFFEALEREIDVSHNATLDRRAFVDLFDHNQVEVIRSFSVEVELNFREYLGHAVQAEGSLERIGRLVEEGLQDRDISRFLYINHDDINHDDINHDDINDDGELAFKRPVFMVLGRKN